MTETNANDSTGNHEKSLMWLFGTTARVLAIIVLSCVVHSWQIQASQDETTKTNKTRAEVSLDTLIPSFVISGQDVLASLNELNKISDAPINAEFSAGPSNPSFSLQDASLRGILDKFVTETNAKWTQQDKAINIVDTRLGPDYEDAMTIPLDSFETENVSSVEAAMMLFVRPELLGRRFYVIFIDARRLGGDRPISLKLTKVTPRQVLNEIVVADGRSYWTIFTQNGSRYFTFHPR